MENTKPIEDELTDLDWEIRLEKVKSDAIGIADLIHTKYTITEFMRAVPFIIAAIIDREELPMHEKLRRSRELSLSIIDIIKQYNKK